MISSEALGEIDEAKEKENMNRVEAALFISGRFLSVPELVSLTDVNPILLKQLLDKLAEKYVDSGIEIVKKNELWKMDAKAEHGEIVNKLATGNAEFSRAEQETLAIIAYKQPIKQSVIIKIRGNKAYEHIKKFRDIGLVRAKRLGHTLELSLSDEFYDYFKVSKSQKDFDDDQKSEENKMISDMGKREEKEEREQGSNKIEEGKTAGQ